MIIQSKLLYFLTISLILYRFVNLTAQATLVRDKYNYCRHVVKRRGRRGEKQGWGCPLSLIFPTNLFVNLHIKTTNSYQRVGPNFFPEHVKTESEQ